MQIKQFLTITTTSNYNYYSFDNVLNNNGKKNYSKFAKSLIWEYLMEELTEIP